MDLDRIAAREEAVGRSTPFSRARGATAGAARGARAGNGSPGAAERGTISWYALGNQRMNDRGARSPTKWTQPLPPSPVSGTNSAVDASSREIKWVLKSRDVQLDDLVPASHATECTARRGDGLEGPASEVIRCEFPAEGHRSPARGSRVSILTLPPAGAAASRNTAAVMRYVPPLYSRFKAGRAHKWEPLRSRSCGCSVFFPPKKLPEGSLVGGGGRPSGMTPSSRPDISRPDRGPIHENRAGGAPRGPARPPNRRVTKIVAAISQAPYRPLPGAQEGPQGASPRDKETPRGTRVSCLPYVANLFSFARLFPIPWPTRPEGLSPAHKAPTMAYVQGGEERPRTHRGADTRCSASTRPAYD